MNAKEEILKMMKQQLKSCEMYCDWKLHSEIEALIAATEAAIFDVPSEEEMTKECMKFTDTAKNVQNAIIYTAFECFYLRADKGTSKKNDGSI